MHTILTEDEIKLRLEITTQQLPLLLLKLSSTNNTDCIVPAQTREHFNHLGRRQLASDA
jgi:hypothetical protein